MIKKQIVIDLVFANEWQEEIHMEKLNSFIDLVKTCMTTGVGVPACKHKKNKLDYKITTIK